MALTCMNASSQVRPVSWDGRMVTITAGQSHISVFFRIAEHRDPWVVPYLFTTIFGL
jgi:hypothetical protein